MATRRRRRRNPMPTTGALLVNPRRRKRKTTRRKRRTTAVHRRRNTTKAARSRAAKLGWARRKRNGTKAGSRRKTARRAYARKTNRKRSTRRGGVRRTARRAYMRKNTRRGGVRRTARRAYARRRNIGAITGLQTGLRKVPVVGGALAEFIGYAPQALFGAVSVEPALLFLKYVGKYVPAPIQALNFTIAGSAIAALLSFVPSKMLKPALKKQLQIAAATGGGAIDYYRWRTEQSTVEDLEEKGVEGFGDYGALLTTAGYGGDMGDMGGGYGALLTTAGYGGGHDAYADYSDADYADAAYSGEDFTGDEASAFMAGPKAFRSRFPKRVKRPVKRGQGRPSAHAGRHGHRWGWLVKWIGFQGAQQVVALPALSRRQVLAQLRKQAIASLPEIVAGIRATPAPVDASGGSTVEEAEAAGYGALLTTAGW